MHFNFRLLSAALIVGGLLSTTACSEQQDPQGVIPEALNESLDNARQLEDALQKASERTEEDLP